MVGAQRSRSWVMRAQPGLLVCRYWMQAERSVSAQTLLSNDPTCAHTREESASTRSR